jgi:hypothetical protein
VVAELFRDGQPPFTFAQLLAYRNGQFDVKHVLDTIDDLPIRVRWAQVVSLNLGPESFL